MMSLNILLAICMLWTGVVIFPIFYTYVITMDENQTLSVPILYAMSFALYNYACKIVKA